MKDSYIPSWTGYALLAGLGFLFILWLLMPMFILAGLALFLGASVGTAKTTGMVALTIWLLLHAVIIAWEPILKLIMSRKFYKWRKKVKFW